MATCELINLFFCFFRKRKSRVGETLAQWKEYQTQLESCNVDTNPIRKVQAIGSKKGWMKGKGGPETSQCN
jgi:EREBP-like factor